MYSEAIDFDYIVSLYENSAYTATERDELIAVARKEACLSGKSSCLA